MSAPLESFPTANANDNAGQPAAEMRHAIQEFSLTMNQGRHALQAYLEGAAAAQRDSLHRLDRMADTVDQVAKHQAQELDGRLGAIQRQIETRLAALQRQVDDMQAQASEDRRRLSQMSVQLAVHDQSVTTYGRTSDDVREMFSAMSRSSGGRASKAIWSIAGAILVVLITLQVIEPQKLVDLIRIAENMFLSRGL